MIEAALLRQASWKNGRESLLQQSIDFDFASRGEINASIYYYGDYEARRECGAITLAVLFRGVDRRAEFCGVKGVEDGRFVVGTVPRFGGDGPDDCILRPFSWDEAGGA